MWQLWSHNKKTEEVYQPAPRKPYKKSSITVKVNGCKWWSSSPTLEAHCLELWKLMMKSVPGLPNLVQHVAEYVEVFGIEVESLDTKRMWNVNSFNTNGMPKYWTTSIQTALENFLRSSDKTGFQKRAGMHSEIGTIKMDRPYYQNTFIMSSVKSKICYFMWIVRQTICMKLQHFWLKNEYISISTYSSAAVVIPF